MTWTRQHPPLPEIHGEPLNYQLSTYLYPCRQRASASGQRGWKLQPDGGVIGLGTSPRTASSPRPRREKSGMAASSMRV